jgi:hypothetical protein
VQPDSAGEVAEAVRPQGTTPQPDAYMRVLTSQASFRSIKNLVVELTSSSPSVPGYASELVTIVDSAPPLAVFSARQV